MSQIEYVAQSSTKSLAKDEPQMLAQRVGALKDKALNLVERRTKTAPRTTFKELATTLRSLDTLSNGAVNPLLVEIAIWNADNFYTAKNVKNAATRNDLRQSIIAIFDYMDVNS
jgi:hypothetical protein